MRPSFRGLVKSTGGPAARTRDSRLRACPDAFGLAGARWLVFGGIHRTNAQNAAEK